MGSKLCKSCNTEKPLTIEFWHKSKRKKDGWEYNCKECVKKRTLANYYANKEKWNKTTRKNKAKQRQRINEYKDTLSCSKCNESRNWLLDFHHPDPNEKEFQISQGERYGWEKVKKEIDKCIPLCSNCHRDFHYQEKQTGVSIEEYLNLKS
jgi:predicted HNH restriction endonuclease